MTTTGEMKPVACKCGGVPLVDKSVADGNYVLCSRCNCVTPYLTTLDAAIRVWNAMQAQSRKETDESI